MHHHGLSFSPMGWNKKNNSAFQGRNVSAYIENVEWASLAQIGMMIWFWLVPFGDVAIKTVPMQITNYEFAKNGLVEGKCWSIFKITHILPNLSTNKLSVVSKTYLNKWKWMIGEVAKGWKLWQFNCLPLNKIPNYIFFLLHKSHKICQNFFFFQFMGHL